jgi:hypothetical protein
MTKLEELEDEAFNNKVHIIDYSFKSERIKGLYCDGTVALDKTLLQTEKACVLAEELGHHYTASGNIIDTKNIDARKQELKGRMLSYNKMIGLYGIINSYKRGCYSINDMAEFLDVTEGFLSEALCYYRCKYGVRTIIDNYVIYFEPSLGVLELV